jgi:hypothetical protein
MLRLPLAGMLTASLLGPWGGCDRGPVGPPASPPGERAPEDRSAPAELPAGDGILLITTTRTLG